jgi:hypothetical protein
MAETDPPAGGEKKPREPFLVDAEVKCVTDGREVTLSFRCEPRQVRAIIRGFPKVGLEPAHPPLVWDLTPEGLPICPRHRVPMSKHEKQGDVWYNHPVLDDQGRKVPCRGYPGPNSQGYEFDELTKWKDTR